MKAPLLPGAARWNERIRIFLQPPRQLRPTRAGWMFLLINFGVGFAALNTGNNLLYLVLSLLLAFLTLSGILSESALRGIEVRRTLPKELIVGADNPVWIEVRNAQRKVPAFAIVVEDRSSMSHSGSGSESDDWRLVRDADLAVLGRVFALRVDPEQTEPRSYALRPERRGELCFHSVRVSTRFPFGLFLKSRTLYAPGRALVYPQVEALRATAPAARCETSTEVSPRSLRRSGGDDISGLREWQPGDSLRRVHWKSSLRRDRLHVRNREDDSQAEIEVCLRTHDGQSPEQFEERVVWAASEVVSHLEAGSRVGLVTDRDHIRAEFGTRQRARLLSFLALVDLDRPGATAVPGKQVGSR